MQEASRQQFEPDHDPRGPDPAPHPRSPPRLPHPPTAAERLLAARRPNFAAHNCPHTALCIDNGASTLRAGWSTNDSPRLAFENIAAKFQDRKTGRVKPGKGRQLSQRAWVRQRAFAVVPMREGIVDK
ncbi:hypothetical protein RTBOTA2_007009 [Rhodotorula toruloides]|nr:hypothetical protein RTBOTA2_007009 [Rhodotorula toruloides]